MEQEQEVQLTSTSGEESSGAVIRKADIKTDGNLSVWFPSHLYEEYYETDLTYTYCVKLFGFVEAAKRESIPKETARQWFIEFVRKGWTKKILSKRYRALMDTKIYGVDKLDIADWVNAVPVFSENEVNRIIDARIKFLITRGNYLKDKKIELTEEDKTAIDLAEAQQVKFKYESGLYAKRETYQQERRRFWEKKFGVNKNEA